MKKFGSDLAAVALYNASIAVLSLILCSAFMRLDFLSAVIFIYFFRMTVYAGLSTLAVSAVVLLLTHRRKRTGLLRSIDNRQIITGFVISFFLIYTFLSLTAFTNDRSYTIFSLGYLYDNSETAYTQQEMEEIFIDGFVVEFGATKKRLEEQMNTGYIEEADGKYRISESGKRFVELQRFIDRFFPTATNPSSLYPGGNSGREIIRN